MCVTCVLLGGVTVYTVSLCFKKWQIRFAVFEAFQDIRCEGSALRANSNIRPTVRGVDILRIIGGELLIDFHPKGSSSTLPPMPWVDHEPPASALHAPLVKPAVPRDGRAKRTAPRLDAKTEQLLYKAGEPAPPKAAWSGASVAGHAPDEVKLLGELERRQHAANAATRAVAAATQRIHDSLRQTELARKALLMRQEREAKAIISAHSHTLAAHRAARACAGGGAHGGGGGALPGSSSSSTPNLLSSNERLTHAGTSAAAFAAAAGVVSPAPAMGRAADSTTITTAACASSAAFCTHCPSHASATSQHRPAPSCHERLSRHATMAHSNWREETLMANASIWRRQAADREARGGRTWRPNVAPESRSSADVRLELQKEARLAEGRERKAGSSGACSGACSVPKGSPLVPPQEPTASQLSAAGRAPQQRSSEQGKHQQKPPAHRNAPALHPKSLVTTAAATAVAASAQFARSSPTFNPVRRQASRLKRTPTTRLDQPASDDSLPVPSEKLAAMLSEDAEDRERALRTAEAGEARAPSQAEAMVRDIDTPLHP